MFYYMIQEESFDCEVVEIKKTGQPNNYVYDVKVI